MIAQESVPVYATLADVFGSVEASLPHVERWNTLSEQFKERFGRTPAYIARAPGRVNLIGEHIDYSLFSVLPAAVDRDILIACAPRPLLEPEHRKSEDDAPGNVTAENLHPKYTRQVFTPASRIPEKVDDKNVHADSWFLDINKKELRWESYVKAGYFGVLNQHFGGRGKEPVPVDLLVTGTVPAGSGLSSSAAMVVASTLAFLAVNGKFENKTNIISKGELVQLAMLNEKRVGVNSGGMDQAASVMSDPSSALQIDFYPSLKASAVPLPTNAVFVIANSLIVADKLTSAKRGYNLRVVETLVSARILASTLGVQIGDKEKITLREIVGRYSKENEGEDMGAVELEKVLGTLLDGDTLNVLKTKETKADGELGVTMEEMIKMSGLAKQLFDEVYLSIS